MRYSNEPSGLKRSLAAARAEIERLKDQVEMQRKLFAESALLAVEWERKAEKAEAERDEALAQVAVIIKEAVNICKDSEASTSDDPDGRMISAWFNDTAREIQALTPADAKSALEAYGREKVREGMRKAAELFRDANHGEHIISTILAEMEALK